MKYLIILCICAAASGIWVSAKPAPQLVNCGQTPCQQSPIPCGPTILPSLPCEQPQPTPCAPPIFPSVPCQQPSPCGQTFPHTPCDQGYFQQRGSLSDAGYGTNFRSDFLFPSYGQYGQQSAGSVAAPTNTFSKMMGSSSSGWPYGNIDHNPTLQIIPTSGTGGQLSFGLPTANQQIPQVPMPYTGFRAG